MKYLIQIVALLVCAISVQAQIVVPNQPLNESQIKNQLITLTTYDPSVRDSVNQFYTENAYDPIWVNNKNLIREFKKRLEEFGDACSESEITTIDSLDEVVNKALTIVPSKFSLNDELSLTAAFIKFSQTAYEPTSKLKGKIAANWFITPPKISSINFLKQFVENKGDDYDSYEPVNWMYRPFLKKINQLKNIIAKGGWEKLPETGYPKLGKENNIMLLFKKRLQEEDYISASNKSPQYDKETLQAVEMLYKLYGLKPSKEINPKLIRQLNKSASDRLSIIKKNFERVRRIPDENYSDLLFVNIPELHLNLYLNGIMTKSIRAIVGKFSSPTPCLNSHLKNIIINPYWNIPSSIVKKEMMGRVNNPEYLASHNMEVYGKRGNLPLVRQKPGPNNALGFVKFFFPNDQAIYFHDTPTKSKFNTNQRFFSHGCVRLAKPYELAVTLLHKMKPSYSAVNLWNDIYGKGKGKEKWIRITYNLPVIITYLTVRPNQQGYMVYLKDPYKYDSSKSTDQTSTKKVIRKIAK